MSSTTFAGLDFTWDANNATIESTGRTLSIQAGLVAMHSTRYGGSTSLSNLTLLGDAVLIHGTSITHAATEDCSIYFGTSGRPGSLWIKTDFGTRPLAELNGEGSWSLWDGVSSRIRFIVNDYNRDSTLEVGTNNYTRGVVLIKAAQILHEAEQPTGYDDRPGVLVLESVSGVRMYLWARHSAGVTELRVDAADPGTNDAPATSKVLVSLP